MVEVTVWEIYRECVSVYTRCAVHAPYHACIASPSALLSEREGRGQDGPPTFAHSREREAESRGECSKL